MNQFSGSISLLIPFFLYFNCVHFTSTAQTTQQVIIGNTSGPSNTAFGPIYRNTGNAGLINYSRHNYLYLPTELAIPSGSKIIGVDWMKKDTGRITGNNSFGVWMMNTSITSLPSTAQWNALTSGATQVFTSSNFEVPPGANTWVITNFADSFVYNGGSLQISVDWSKFGFASAGIAYYTQTAAGRCIGIASNLAFNPATSLSAANFGGSRPTIRIRYVTVPPCTGTPNPGNTLCNVTASCPGVPFSLTLQNTTIGGLVSYEWQRSATPGFIPFVTVGTNSTLTTTQNGNFYYRCKVTCGNGGAFSFSTPKYLPESPGYGCYCSSSAQSDADEEIFKVSFGTFQNCSDCNSLAPGSYSVPRQYGNYQTLPPIPMPKGIPIPFLIDVGVCSQNVYPNQCAIFIDFNQNQSFADPGERVYFSPGPTNGAHTENGFFTIPQSALTGNTGLRVICSEQTTPISNPCLLYPWGETEDYVVNIQGTNNCSGTPNPGQTIAYLTNSCIPLTDTVLLCPGKGLNLSLQQQVLGSGIIYQWLQNGVPISGATNSVYQTQPFIQSTSYSCLLTCLQTGMQAISTPLTLVQDIYLNCYCNSRAGNNANSAIQSFSLGGSTQISNCTTAAPGPGSILNQYSNFTSNGVFATLNSGSSVSFSCYIDDCDIPPTPYFDYTMMIWIDLNQNGSFLDAGELLYADPSPQTSPRIFNGTLNIPCSALEGITRMRVTIAEGLSASQINPCMIYTSGETEDYLVQFSASGACTLPIPSPGNTLASTTILCDSTRVQLSIQNNCLQSPYTFQWLVNGNPIPGATNRTYLTPKIFTSASYSCRISCGSNQVFSTPVLIQTSIVAPFTVTANAPWYCSGQSPVNLQISGSTNLSYQWIPLNGLSSNSGLSVMASPSVTTTYTVIATNTFGCSKTSTITLSTQVCSQTLNLQVYHQGYYAGSGSMSSVAVNQGTSTQTNFCDSIQVELRQSTPPYGLVYQGKIALMTNGNATITVPLSGGNFYIVIKHRNTLESWSSIPVNISSGSYNFSTQGSQVFGANQIQMEPGFWALFTGDLNQDENIDLLDLSLLETDINLFGFGNLATDLNGDGNVDLIDTPVMESNIANFIYVIKP